MLTDQPIKLAVVGAGVMGANHARVASRTQGVELVAIIDIDEAKRTTLAESMGVRHAASIGELLESAELNAAIVATPTQFHHRVAVECLDAGLHVLVEKPIAPTAEEAASANRLAIACFSRGPRTDRPNGRDQTSGDWWPPVAANK